MFGRNAADLQLHTKLLQPLESSHIGVVNGNGTCNLTLAFCHVHVSDVDLLDGDATLHQLDDILRVLADDEDQLLGAGLVDGIDRLLDGPVAHCSVGGSSHIHQALTQAVASHLVVGHQNKVCTNGATPLRCDLTVHKTVVDPRKNNVRHSQIPP